MPALTLSNTQIDELGVCWSSVIRKLFGYNKWESVKSVLCGLRRLNIKHLIMLRKVRFYAQKLVVGQYCLYVFNAILWKRCYAQNSIMDCFERCSTCVVVFQMLCGYVGVFWIFVMRLLIPHCLSFFIYTHCTVCHSAWIGENKRVHKIVLKLLKLNLTS